MPLKRGFKFGVAMIYLDLDFNIDNNYTLSKNYGMAGKLADLENGYIKFGDSDFIFISKIPPVSPSTYLVLKKKQRRDIEKYVTDFFEEWLVNSLNK